MLTGLLVLLSSCSNKINFTTTQKFESFNDQAYRYYKSDVNLRYDFFRDDSSLIVLLSTDERSTQIRIVRKGVKILLCEGEKKSSERYVQYPFASQPKPFKKYNGMQNNTEKRPPIAQIIANNISKEALFYENGTRHPFNLETAPLDFHFLVTADSAGFLIYKAMIPLKKLHFNPADSTTLVGINIETIDMPQNFSGGGQGGGYRQQEDGQKPEGENEVVQGQRPGGPPSGQNMPNMESASDKIEFWYRIKL
jgi:hypothetical protein